MRRPSGDELETAMMLLSANRGRTATAIASPRAIARAALVDEQRVESRNWLRDRHPRATIDMIANIGNDILTSGPAAVGSGSRGYTASHTHCLAGAGRLQL
jgi:hypothetical protein